MMALGTLGRENKETLGSHLGQSYGCETTNGFVTAESVLSLISQKYK